MVLMHNTQLAGDENLRLFVSERTLSKLYYYYYCLFFFFFFSTAYFDVFDVDFDDDFDDFENDVFWCNFFELFFVGQS